MVVAIRGVHHRGARETPPPEPPLLVVGPRLGEIHKPARMLVGNWRRAGGKLWLRLLLCVAVEAHLGHLLTQFHSNVPVLELDWNGDLGWYGIGIDLATTTTTGTRPRPHRTRGFPPIIAIATNTPTTTTILADTFREIAGGGWGRGPCQALIIRLITVRGRRGGRGRGQGVGRSGIGTGSGQ